MNDENKPNKSPLVSVIIPTYNNCRWIAAAINSATAQTYKNCEIIVIDDGSTDGTKEFLDSQYGDEITYLYQDNQGRGAARNMGLALAEGKYIQFLDADDILLPEKIEKQVAYLEGHDEIAVVYGDAMMFNEDDIKNTWEPPQKYQYVSGWILKDMIHNPFLWTAPSLVRQDWIDRVGGFDASLRRIEDWDLWLRLASGGATIQYYPDECVSFYRQNIRNALEDKRLHTYSKILVLKKLKDNIGDKREVRKLEIPYAIKQARFAYGKALIQSGMRWPGILQVLMSFSPRIKNLPERLLFLFLPLFIGYDSIDAINGKLLYCYKRIKAIIESM